LGRRYTVLPDGGESAKVCIVLGVEAWLLHKLPPPLHEVHGGRVRREVQSRDAKRGSDGLDQRPTLGARLVQDQGDRDLPTQGPSLSQSRADTLRMAIRAGGDGEHRLGDGLERAEPREPLPPAGRFAPTPGAAPQRPQQRAADHRRRLHQKDGPRPRLCRGEAGLSLFFCSSACTAGAPLAGSPPPLRRWRPRGMRTRRTCVGLRRMPVRGSRLATASLLVWGGCSRPGVSRGAREALHALWGQWQLSCWSAATAPV
jgi:hypothetical protein